MLAPAGTRIPDVAELSYNTALQYNFSITNTLLGFARISYSYTGDAHALLTADHFTPSYQIVNFRAGVERENWQLTVFVNNMFDEYIMYWDGGTYDTDLYIGTSVNTVGRPRTIGVSFKYNF